MDSNDITRRRLIGALGAAGMAGLAGCGGGDDATATPTDADGGDGDGDGGTPTPTEDGGDGGTPTPTEDGGTTTAPPVSGEVTIGVIQPLSGALQYYGQSALWGFYSGLKYKGDDATTVPAAGDGTGEYSVSVGDLEYTLHVGDTGGASGEAQNLATEFAQSNDADIIFGGTSSASATSVATNVANAGNIPYMAGPAASVSVTGSSETCSANVFRASENVAMDSRSGGTYVAEETDIESVWIYYADYSFGQSVQANYQRVLEDQGVSVAGTTPLAADYSEDWPGQFQKAVDAGVDGIIGGFTVAALPSMVGTFLSNQDTYDFSFIGGLTTLAGATALGQTAQNVLGDLTTEKLEQAGLGPFTTRYHWNQYDNAINDDFIDIYSSRYGSYPDLFTSGTFTSATAIHEAIQNEGEVSRDAIRSGLTGLTVQDTPKGEGGYTFQEYNNQARSAMTVAPVVPTENQDLWPPAIQPGAPVQTYSKDVTTLPSDSSLITCSL